MERQQEKDKITTEMQKYGGANQKTGQRPSLYQSTSGGVTDINVGSYKGISLLSIAEKIYGNII